MIADGLVHKEKGLFTKGTSDFITIQLIGVVVIWAFTTLLTYVFFRLVVSRFHLRLSKIEEILGLDSQEDEYRVKLTIEALIKERTKESLAKLTLLHMVNAGNHVAIKKGKKKVSPNQEQKVKNMEKGKQGYVKDSEYQDISA